MIKFLYQIARGSGLAISGAVLLSSLTTLSAIGLMGTSSLLIVQAGFHPSISALQVAIVGVRFFGISRAFFRYLERLLSHSVNLRLLAKIRSLLFSKIKDGFPFGLDQHSSSSLLGVLVQDIDALENLFVRFLLPVASSFVVTLSMSLFLGIFSADILIVYLVGTFLVGILLPVLSAWIGQISSQSLDDARGKYQTFLITFLQGFQEALQFGRTDLVLKEAASLTTALSRPQWHQKMIQAFFTSGSFLLIQITGLLVLWVMLSRNSLQESQVIGLAAVYLIVIASFESIQNLPTAGSIFGNLKQSLLRITQLQSKVARESRTKAVIPEQIFPIELKDVQFRFPQSNQDVVENIQFIIEKNQKIAIVGPSGSGKSTLLNLLSSFYRPSHGQIILGQTDLAKIEKPWWRQQITFFADDAYIFSTSLDNNIQLANENNSREEIERIVRDIGLKNRFANLQDSVLSEHASNLSSGEKQRIELARLLARNSELYLIDEPFKNIDGLLAFDLNELLRKHLSDKSVVWVTHHYHKMEYFDKILVLHNGKIVESGTHRELLEEGMFYAQLLNQ